MSEWDRIPSLVSLSVLEGLMNCGLGCGNTLYVLDYEERVMIEEAWSTHMLFFSHSTTVCPPLRG